MLFNSLSFLLFFPITTAIYFLLPHKFRWIHLLACSCLFYAAFIPAYLLILFGVILVDYLAGILIERASGKGRSALLILSLLANVGLLGMFKYYDFANYNLHGVAEFLHWKYPIRHLGMILPIGLSFHTFQSMAYTIEVYRGRQKAEWNLGIYSLYVMFYPQLVAGPIERPQHLLHQFREHHLFNADRIFDGLKQMLWGAFKKVVIADRLGVVVDAIYAAPSHAGGAYLILATWFFAIQIYCDFSGYTDMAIGAARILGFRLIQNFDRPYAATSVVEFWRRWHISLSTWFRDYLYIPLGGSRVGVPRWCFNVMVVFIVSGLWHGASWTFAIWGALHGIYLIASRLSAGWRWRIGGRTGILAHPILRKALQRVLTFNLVSFAWIFFRAPTLADAWKIVAGIPRRGFWNRPHPTIGLFDVPAVTSAELNVSLGLILFLQVAEWAMDWEAAATERRRPPIWARWAGYYAIILMILWIGALGGKSFIYFQF